MHRVQLNSLELELELSLKSPLLIKSGGISPNPSLPDMQFVRTFISGKGEIVYIPGSSLKGVIRSHVERVLRTLSEIHNKETLKWACNLFEKDKACVSKIKDEARPFEIYRDSCRACKIFGNTKLKGRISILDSYPNGNVKTEIRHGVAISRLTHAVAQGPFDIEVAVEGIFKTKFILTNFEAWSIGLLAIALRDINEGMVKVGFGKNRGFGEVEAKVQKATFGFAGNTPKNEIWGIGKMSSENNLDEYGLNKDDLFDVNTEPKEESKDILGVKRIYDFEGWEAIGEASITYLREALK
jgi:CRISPR-associated RAMP protein (TIGR02581 family)